MISAITGASGFLGLNLIQVLLDAGHEVRAIDRARSAHLDPRVAWCPADILDKASLMPAFDSADFVFHLAAKITLLQDDPVAWHLNTEGVRCVAEAARESGVRRMVHVSSIASFDQFRWRQPMVETAPRATDPTQPIYGRSKYAGECEFLKVVDQGLDGVIGYPTGVYGPIDHGTPLSRINAVLLDSARGRVPVMVEGGFDLVDVRDVAAGLLLAAERGQTGENYMLGGQYIRMIDAFRLSARLVGRHGPLFALPLKPLKAVAPMIERMVARLGVEADFFSQAALTAIETSPRVDHTKATRDLGYAPRSLETSMKDLVAFFVQRGLFAPADAVDNF